MWRIKRHWKLITVAASCAALGAGAGVIANAGAATGSGGQAPHATGASGRHRGLARRRLFGRAVHGDLVVAAKNGFVTVTLDRGIVQTVQGQQLTLNEGTKTATYKTITLTIPATARVRDNRHSATLGDVKPGQRVLVVQNPRRTLVVARDARSS